MTAPSTELSVPGYQAATWNIDAAHSEVGFSVRHMMVSKVRGKFDTFSGQFVTGEDPLGSSVTAEIELASINTGNEQRDEHIRSADFFEVEKHQKMTYRSTGVRVSDGEYVLDGELTIKGITKPVELSGIVRGPVPVPNHDGSSSDRLGLDLTTTVNRRDFGLTGEGGAADDVTVEVSLELVAQ